MSEVAADGPALGHGHVSAEDQRGDELLAEHRVPVDLPLQEPDQDRRALRVADEHDAAALVVVGEVVAKRRQDTPVGNECVGERDPARVIERTEGDLAVDRRIDLADLRELRDLRDGDGGLPEPDLEVRVHGRLIADRRVDVETVDRRALRGLGTDDVGGTVRRDDRRREVREARIRDLSGSAQPDGAGRARRGDRRRRRAALRAAAARRCEDGQGHHGDERRDAHGHGRLATKTYSRLSSSTGVPAKSPSSVSSSRPATSSRPSHSFFVAHQTELVPPPSRTMSMRLSPTA